jgi:hypothetical protein
MKWRSPLVGSAVKENAAIKGTRESQMSGTKLKALYIRVPQRQARLYLVPVDYVNDAIAK